MPTMPHAFRRRRKDRAGDHTPDRTGRTWTISCLNGVLLILAASRRRRTIEATTLSSERWPRSDGSCQTSEDKDAITFITANETLTIPKGDVEERKLSEQSMMPEDQLKPMTDQEIHAR